MTILVTGAAGFIGYHVAKHLLNRGEKVIGLDNLNPYYDVRLKEARVNELKKYPHFHFHLMSYGKISAVVSPVILHVLHHQKYLYAYWQA